MYTVYAISSMNKGYIYVGHTSNLSRRLEEHNNGKERTTRSYAPYKLTYTELKSTRPEAREREKYLKSGVGKEFLRSLV